MMNWYRKAQDMGMNIPNPGAPIVPGGPGEMQFALEEGQTETEMAARVSDYGRQLQTQLLPDAARQMEPNLAGLLDQVIASITGRDPRITEPLARTMALILMNTWVQAAMRGGTANVAAHIQGSEQVSQILQDALQP